MGSTVEDFEATADAAADLGLRIYLGPAYRSGGMVCEAPGVLEPVFVDGRLSMRDGAVPGIDLVAARKTAQSQFERLLARYPERTFGHPRVEDMFPGTYPTHDGHP